jgi:hypothetical protein
MSVEGSFCVCAGKQSWAHGEGSAGGTPKTEFDHDRPREELGEELGGGLEHRNDRDERVAQHVAEPLRAPWSMVSPLRRAGTLPSRSAPSDAPAPSRRRTSTWRIMPSRAHIARTRPGTS